MRLLLLSNSTNKGEKFLEYPREDIKLFLGKGPLKVLFIPFAAVTFGYDEYEKLVAESLSSMGDFQTTSVHRYKNFFKAIKEADVIAVGGGNSYRLLHQLQNHHLIEKIRERVLKGTPYIGWSAGANVACPAISTTNDMPVVWPKSLKAFNLVPFQINPHFTEQVPDNFAGETREMRLKEYIHINRGIYIVGLREGTLLRIENNEAAYIGKMNAKIFHSDKEVIEIEEGEDINFLIR